MTRALYILAAYLLAPLYCAVLLAKGLRERRYWQDFGQRFGLGSRLTQPTLWVHAASVGEVQAAAPLVRELRRRHPDIPLIITCITPTGRDQARALFADSVELRFLPVDLPGAVRRFLDRIRPRIAVIFETELWPNLYHECHRRGVPIVIGSARISARSLGRYRRVSGLIGRTLSRDVTIAAQTEADAARFLELGADAARVRVTGNIKFDLADPAPVVERGKVLRAQFNLLQRPVWIAGSTHEGEEEQVLEAHRRVRAAAVDALLILVPRHPPRFDAVAEILRRSGVRFARRSKNIPCEDSIEVLLVDSVGELLDFYAAADVAFVGGSLVPIGGHNLLEPASLGLPVLTGPHYSNAQEVARLLVSRNATRIVRNAQELAAQVVNLLERPEERAEMGARARECIAENRGALKWLLALIEPLLASATTS